MPNVVRTCHPWLHPTKGWRQFSRPGKPGQRRRLIPQGVALVPGSAPHNARQRRETGFRLTRALRVWAEGFGVGRYGKKQAAKRRAAQSPTAL
jgi:hypothetical protein